MTKGILREQDKRSPEFAGFAATLSRTTLSTAPIVVAVKGFRRLLGTSVSPA